MNKRFWLSIFLTVSFSGSCSTTETHPSRVSWGDLLTGDRLENHLNERRQKLNYLQQKNHLAQSVFNRMQLDLEIVYSELEAATSTSVNNKTSKLTLINEIEQAMRQLEYLIKENRRLRKQIQSLQRVETDDRKRYREIRRNEIEIEKLVVEKEDLQKWINQIIETRTKYLSAG